MAFIAFVLESHKKKWVALQLKGETILRVWDIYSRFNASAIQIHVSFYEEKV